MGAYSRLVPSMRTAPVATTTSSLWTDSSMPPQVPTRIKVWAPRLASSSMAMAAEGPPMPVDTTLTRSPSSSPVQVSNSRLVFTCTAPSNRWAMALHRPGSPGRMQYLPTSPWAHWI